LINHAPDVRLGQSARDLAFEQFRLDGDTRALYRGRTNGDGHAPAAAARRRGIQRRPSYEIVFAAGDYQGPA